MSNKNVQLGILRNRLFDEIFLGDTASLERTLTLEDIQLFALQAGDANLSSVETEPFQLGNSQSIVGPGIWGGSLISALIGTQLPGPGTKYLNQSLSFLKPVQVGDTLKVSLTVIDRDESSQMIVLDCQCVNQEGVTVIEGQARVQAPVKRIEKARANLPEIKLSETGENGLQGILNNVQSLEAIKVGVVHPCDEVSLKAALDAHQLGLIQPILIAPRARLEAVAKQCGFDLEGLDIEDVPHSHAAAARAVELAGQGQLEALMKGSIHTDELMSAVVDRQSTIRTKRRISHCFLMQTSYYSHPFIVTDAAINLSPNLYEKADIIRNAIDLSKVIGVEEPKVAILAAVETVNANMPATLDAAALCKMADRGQIEGAVLDGPLAFDNAVSIAAARIKGIHSPVAGQADILLVPDLESGNMLAKQLLYLGDATSAGIVLGAKVPIVLTSRADSQESRLASCAISMLLAYHYREKPL